jgi:hypothetical protein
MPLPCPQQRLELLDIALRELLREWATALFLLEPDARVTEDADLPGAEPDGDGVRHGRGRFLRSSNGRTHRARQTTSTSDSDLVYTGVPSCT